jgi:uncharacterized protein YegL
MAPYSEPAALNLNIISSFTFPGSAKEATYLFVIDTSGSVGGAPLEGIKNSAREFIRLMGQNDRAGIMTFDDDPKLISSFTSEKKLLRQKIDKLRTAGKKTVLFDALMAASNLISREDREYRFIVLISDGKDEGSHSTIDNVIQETRRSGASILSIGYSKVEKEHLTSLRKLAGQTGGDFVHAPHFHDILTLYDVSRDTGTEETARPAFLEVKSRPTGARVYVNGRLEGETPLNLELPVGKHEIRLALPDYNDWAAQIVAGKGDTIPISVRLLPTEEKK